MDKKDKVNQILSNIKDQAEELTDDLNTDSMSAEEIVVLATEITLSMPVSSIEYTQPIGIVDRSRVTFMLDEEFEFPLFGDTYYEEE
jgi:hypothetical protein